MTGRTVLETEARPASLASGALISDLSVGNTPKRL